MNRTNLSVQDICLIGIFAAVIAVLAQISIPMPYGVPMTLQTFAIPFAGIVLGAKKGTLATVIYILLGIFGLPVFAGFSGGPASLLGPTGGFIISFPVLAFSAGLGADRNNSPLLIAGLLIGAIINYLCGMLIFSLVTSSELSAAFAACVLPFIPTAIIKIILAWVLGLRAKKILGSLAMQKA